MKERPILFSSGMVQAILEGKKTQTRRVVKKYPCYCKTWWPCEVSSQAGGHSGRWTCEICGGNEKPINCPYGKPGDRLWVRETWWMDGDDQPVIFYGATDQRSDIPLKPSIFMPRWASRITLEVTGVRVERVQDISKADAKSEGMYCGFEPPYDFHIGPYDAYTANFRRLWDSINARHVWDGWDDNPWVWVIEFKVLEVKN